MKELWRTTALIYVNDRQYNTVFQCSSDQGSYAKLHATASLGRRYHLTCVNRWSDCIGYRIEIVCLIDTLSTILQHCTHTMKPSDPLLLADDTLRYGMYPAGKVAISRHLTL